MSSTSNLPAFGAYAEAFEASLADDDWTRLEPYFGEDSVCLPGDGTEAVGRSAVIDALRTSVETLERRCDTRELVQPPDISESGDTVTLKYALKYTKQGVGEFVLSGYETIQYVDGVIVRMEDVFDDPSALKAWRSAILG